MSKNNDSTSLKLSEGNSMEIDKLNEKAVIKSPILSSIPTKNEKKNFCKITYVINQMIIAFISNKINKKSQIHMNYNTKLGFIEKQNSFWNLEKYAQIQ